MIKKKKEKKSTSLQKNNEVDFLQNIIYLDILKTMSGKFPELDKKIEPELNILGDVINKKHGNYSPLLVLGDQNNNFNVLNNAVDYISKKLELKKVVGKTQEDIKIINLNKKDLLFLSFFEDPASKLELKKNSKNHIKIIEDIITNENNQCLKIIALSNIQILSNKNQKIIFELIDSVSARNVYFIFFSTKNNNKLSKFMLYNSQLLDNSQLYKNLPEIKQNNARKLK